MLLDDEANSESNFCIIDNYEDKGFVCGNVGDSDFKNSCANKKIPEIKICY